MSAREQIDVAVQHSRALYELVRFRVEGRDRRVPAAGATIVALVSSVPL